MIGIRRFLLAALVTAVTLNAQAASTTQTLRYTVILSRHGVRSPLTSPEGSRDYTNQTWPTFDSPTGFLTPRGAKLMQLMGDYYRDYFVEKGLLPRTGCGEMDHIYFWADDASRDVETAWAIAQAMMPGCNTTIHHVGEGSRDPLFSPVAANVAKPDYAAERADFLKSAGGSAEALVSRFKPDVDMITEVLLGCAPGPNCPATGVEVKKPIAKLAPLSLPENGNPTSPMLSAAESMGDAIQLEYLDGMPMKDVGWGRVDKQRLYEIRKSHVKYWDMTMTPYAAKLNMSNLLSHMYRSLEQSVNGAAVHGAMGKPDDKALILLGHDSDIFRAGVMLGMSWDTEKGLSRETPPGCALAFEIWRDAATGANTVRAYFQTQTFEQQREATPLSLKKPPLRIALKIPGCDVDGGNACTWQQFQKAMTNAIDPAFVDPAK